MEARGLRGSPGPQRADPGRGRQPGSVGLGWLPPAPRLAVYVLLSSAAALAFDRPWVLAALGLGAALLLAGRRFPRVLLVGCLATALLTFASNALTAADPGARRYGILRISRTSVERGALLATRIAAMMLVSIAYVAVTSKEEILAGVRGLRAPRRVVLYLMIVLRYIDIFALEFETTVRAVRVRGARLDRGSLPARIRAYGALAMPLMARLINRVHTQALAVDSRGILGRGSRVSAFGPDALRVEGLSVLYGEGDPVERTALREASLTVPWGEVALVAGPTDAGKTTLLLAASGLIPQSLGRVRGRVVVAGHDTQERTMTELAQVARYVFPDPVHGLVGLTVRDELEQATQAFAFPAGPRLDSAEALRLVGLDESFLDRSTLRLSGGEMQRVQLASALASCPAVLLLDEPTAHLDPRGREEVTRVLQDLCRGLDGEQRTVLVADPGVDRFSQALDRVVLLERGEVLGCLDRDGARDVGWMERAHLRVPQLRRLGAALGVDIPTVPEEAARALAARARARPSPRARDRRAGEVVLRCRDVSFRYPGGRLAVRRVSLELHPQEFCFLLGPNGSGKTTLSLLLAGALEPLTGSVWWPEGGRVGYVFQEPTLQVVSTTVREELAFGPRNLGWPEARVREATEREAVRFGLDLEANPMAATRSEARRLAVASLLTMEPSVLILDEPTAGLDEREARDLFDELDRLRRSERTTLLVVTHDLELAAEFATRILVMRDGSLWADDDPRVILADSELLAQAGLEAPPVVALSLAMWPDVPPALTAEELTAWLGGPAEVDGRTSRPGELG